MDEYRIKAATSFQKRRRIENDVTCTRHSNVSSSQCSHRPHQSGCQRNPTLSPKRNKTPHTTRSRRTNHIKISIIFNPHKLYIIQPL
ncbi:hypothetical protein BDV33DRAFT_178247 [Aspergillus novoparasiticus]|uniref:Uncharacterized protein n=1 Tax=Aspergillus novoparasiticus TaxID=986946 RepID=A0A5N6EHZ2_9EURO|nr:hypothetical protein BDV33DRAFT_178247 [Aspergillus novoparasiticus]